ncbi:hypothetical protein AXW86_15205 [Pseudomonas aeruginosa]|nr:hypothetical protein A6R75_25515 [Pseudomonas aeruginosa]ERX97209.1 hypothetical protein Q079_01244 [Pseudomonas aeruginosa BL25]ETD46568.1 hypothetical protein X778_28230 [Pseudomonas aeruginosa VRFPA07]EZP11052.1 hypothetical protein V551_04410 [Pseudomonas aeruginosa BWH050]OFQ86330.1 hypothetical protein HMPREF2914_07410 [Pseudomonas sp. HMSC067G02]
MTLHVLFLGFSAVASGLVRRCPLIVPLELVRTLAPRVQKILGFRSQYPNGSPGLWQHNYADLADYLQL